MEEIMTATLHSPYMPSQTLIDQDGYRPILRGIEEEEHERNVGPVFKVWKIWLEFMVSRPCSTIRGVGNCNESQYLY